MQLFRDARTGRFHGRTAKPYRLIAPDLRSGGRSANRWMWSTGSPIETAAEISAGPDTWSLAKNATRLSQWSQRVDRAAALPRAALLRAIPAGSSDCLFQERRESRRAYTARESAMELLKIRREGSSRKRRPDQSLQAAARARSLTARATRTEPTRSRDPLPRAWNPRDRSGAW